MNETAGGGYRPFPAFADWSEMEIDTTVFDRLTAVLDDLRSRPDPKPLARAVEFATRAAAIDTGAIEGLYEVDRGFTMTVARGVAAWEKVIASREPVVRRSFEDALRAYDFVLDLATTRTELSEKAIREIHELICAGQETYRVVTSAGWQERPLPKGTYKDTPNNPTSRVTGEVHLYAPPLDVPAEMSRLVRELRSAGFRSAHPVIQAAWAHYAFVAVHPFADGNGRVARALASVFLYRRPGVPLVIFADQKDGYLDSLEEADRGRPDRFVRFVQERVADVVGLVQVSAQGGAQPASASMAELQDVLMRAEQFSREQTDALAARLLDRAYDYLRERMASLGLPPGVRMSIQNTAPQVRSFGGVAQLVIQLDTDPPADTSLVTAVTCLVTWHETAPALLLRTSLDEDPDLPVEIREIFPTFSGALELKLQLWVEGLLDRLIARLSEQARTVLRQRGAR
ncbi:MAG: Fic family protein [Mycobacteriales bacterium]